MAIQAQVIALASSAEASVAGNAIHGVIRVTVRNAGAGVAYLGPSGLTTAAGFQLTTADAPLTLTVYGGEQLFAYSTGTPTLYVLRMNDTT
jgi:hypothetical protein